MKTLREVIEAEGLNPEDGGRKDFWFSSVYMDCPAKHRVIHGCDAWVAGEIVLIDWESGSQFYAETTAREEFPELFAD